MFMCDGEVDQRIQDRVGDRLDATGKMTPAGRLTDACTFGDVKNTIMRCSVRPGHEDNPFFNARSQVVGNTSTDRFILEAANSMKTMSMETVQTMKAMRDELMMARSTNGVLVHVSSRTWSDIWTRHRESMLCTFWEVAGHRLQAKQPCWAIILPSRVCALDRAWSAQHTPLGCPGWVILPPTGHRQASADAVTLHFWLQPAPDFKTLPNP